jgi:hypothetical protein
MFDTVPAFSAILGKSQHENQQISGVSRTILAGTQPQTAAANGKKAPDQSVNAPALKVSLLSPCADS